MKRALLPLSLVAAVTIVGGLALTCGVKGSKPPSYDVTVNFTTEVMQEDIDATNAALKSYDASLSNLLQESFPPTGHATLHSGVTGFCAAVEQQLKAVHGVAGVTCRPSTTPVTGMPNAPAHSP
jgi:hypothetical protein